MHMYVCVRGACVRGCVRACFGRRLFDRNDKLITKKATNICLTRSGNSASEQIHFGQLANRFYRPNIGITPVRDRLDKIIILVYAKIR